MTETMFSLSLIIVEIIFSLIVLKAFSNAGAKKCMFLAISIIFLIWLIADYTLISNGFFAATGMPQIAFTVVVVIPIVMGFFAIQLYQPLRQVVSNMSTETFLRLQLMRSAFGILFFFTAALPAWFQYVGGLGDVAAGVGAFFALQYFRKNPNKECKAIILGNAVGILDFIVVINLGVLVVLSDHSADIIFNLIPMYVVPMFILLHVYSLMRLAKIKRGLA